MRSALARYGSAVLLVGFLAAVLFAGLSRLWHFGIDGPITNPVDFRAFYCSAHAFVIGADPYRYGPIQACQRAVLANGGLQSDDYHLLFAVLPPAALVLIVPFALLPFRIATELWLVADIFATGCAVWATSRLAVASPVLVAATFALSLGVSSLIIGQVVPFVVASLACSALALRRNDVGIAVFASIVGLLEPNLALPAWLALFVFIPSSRRYFVAFAAVVGALSVAWYPLTREYVLTIISMHARSEVYNLAAQYGLPATLVAFGTPVRIALVAGSLSYVVMLGIGLALGRSLAQRFDDRAFYVVTPIAAVLFGGPFIHIHQMAAALPFALVLCGNVRSARARAGIAFAIVALAIPWQTIAESRAFADRPAHEIVSTVPTLPKPHAEDSIETSYTAFVDANARRLDRRSVAEDLAWKSPTWLALIALMALGYRAKGGPTAVPAPT